MTTKIRIVLQPTGPTALEEVLKQWVSIELPVVPKVDRIASFWWNSDENINGYIVNTRDAIKALRDAGKDQAADFWQKVEHLTGQQLRFGAEFCVVVVS